MLTNRPNEVRAPSVASEPEDGDQPARYDGLAEWYDENLASFVARATEPLVRLLGRGPGSCLEIGCGTGWQLPGIVQAGWSVVGLDLSGDQLRLARQRAPDAMLILATCLALPFAEQTFDAVVIAFVNTDVDDWTAAVHEATRVLRPAGRLVFAGIHPCFVGPFSRYPGTDPPVLFPGYRDTERKFSGPGIGEGLRRRVGERHLRLGELVAPFLAAGLTLESFDEIGPEDFPKQLVMAWRRPGRLAQPPSATPDPDGARSMAK